MKVKLSIYLQPNYLTRTAIVREQKQFIQIAFAVHLSAVISAERHRSDSGALKSAMPVFVYLCIVLIVHKYRQSAAQSCLRESLLLNNPTDRTFENRWSRYKEPSKNKAEAYRVYVEHLFLRSDAGDARIFSKEEDVYGTDYGFGLDAPKETDQTNPQDLFAYRRNYTWNERNLLTKSSDRNFTVHYRYGDDGQRALKYTDEGRSETLYFNNFFTIHIPTQDQNNPQGLRVHKHIFVGNSRLVTAMTHTDNSGDNDEQKAKRYYYHSDHLGSAQFVTDWRGKQYEHIEYTPYGELWIEEVAAGLDKLPFRFTGKELDEETGLYYYGARYLDPKYSRWLSGDPALNDYIPKAPINDEAKKHNENLPGMGGVCNTVNLHVYHYAGNNPVKYVDPDGRDIINFIKGWFNYNLNKAIYSMNRLDYPLNPQFEMANEVLAKIDQMVKSGYSIYIETLQFASENSGTATLLFLAIGQPELAAITGTIGTAADILLGFDDLFNGNYIKGCVGIVGSISLRFVGSGTDKLLSKLGNSINIKIGKNGLYYMKGRKGALKTIDGLRKQLYKDFVEGYFGEAIAPELASQVVDKVIDEISNLMQENKIDE
ncbi:RHS repeat domain-containing protein [Treponema sp. OMZ 799]|uniref:RHS repeat domain-containing protein n=1 Tax=Treponema sp. OMZ 799 TaxID=2563668 RepID=UPI0020A36165|nr:RHS repeat-associated core domain-containing protein [Treponema sp. OMZ 799]